MWLYINLCRILKIIRECVDANYKCGGEIVLTSQLSLKRNIPLYGGEPPDEMIWQHCRQSGITQTEFINYYMLRQIAQWLREGHENEKLISSSGEFLSSLSRHLDFDPLAQLKDFHAWYQLETQLNHFEMNCTTSLLKTHRFEYIGEIITRYRDGFLAQLIKSATEYNGTTLVSYGANHQMQLSNFLHNLCGDPVETLIIDDLCEDTY